MIETVFMDYEVCNISLCCHVIILQDIDPSRRPGAGSDGYSALKMHPFFKGVNWKNIREETPPKIALEQQMV